MSWTQRTIRDWLKTKLPIRDSLEQSWCDGIKARPVEGWSAGKATSGVLAINHFTCWGQFRPKLGGGRTNQDYLPSIGRVLGMVGVNVIQRERRWDGLRYRTEGGVSLLEHKTFGLAINRDYLSTVFTSDHPCPEYIVYSQYTGGLWRNQHQKQKMARPINREGTYFML